MTIERKRIVVTVRDVSLFLLASIIQSYFTCARCTNVSSYVPVVFFTFTMWILLWKGNAYLAGYISKRISWIKFPSRRLVIGIVTTIAYTVAAVVGLMYFFEYVFDFNFGRGFTYTIYGAVIITILISLVLHSQSFLEHWRQADMEREKFEKESMAAKYESLKNQVNPHFLFNSFNALTNLVYEDQDKAAKFIKQLSEVYRYVLDTRDKEVVPLSEELNFLRSYIYLQQIRFGDKLRIDVDIKNTDARIAPLALQMLIENAIKHNIVAEDNPLKIFVYTSEDYVVVENNIQRKLSYAEPSAGVGLENIQKRYEFLSDRKVQVIQNEKLFMVKLPALIERR